MSHKSINGRCMQFCLDTFSRSRHADETSKWGRTQK